MSHRCAPFTEAAQAGCRRETGARSALGRALSAAHRWPRDAEAPLRARDPARSTPTAPAWASGNSADAARAPGPQVRGDAPPGTAPSDLHAPGDVKFTAPPGRPGSRSARTRARSRGDLPSTARLTDDPRLRPERSTSAASSRMESRNVPRQPCRSYTHCRRSRATARSTARTSSAASPKLRLPPQRPLGGRRVAAHDRSHWPAVQANDRLKRRRAARPWRAWRRRRLSARRRPTCDEVMEGRS